ncbi:MAG: hypothetical protein ACRDNM_04055 [Gaiellaceae bacterium]
MSGTKARAAVIVIALVAGLVVGAVTVSAQHRWVNIRHDHHHRDDG